MNRKENLQSRLVQDPKIVHWRQGEDVQNFGDFLTVILCKELFLFPRVEADIYRIVGSCIAEWMVWQDLADLGRQEYGRIAYWGCGMRDEAPIPPALLERCRFYGVRGPLSRDVLGLAKNTPLADPGLLAPLFHKPRPSPTTRGKVLCMPHINDDKPDQVLLGICGAEGVIRPTVDNNEEALCALLDKIAGARFLLTGSLHGAILACAYNVPFAFWDNGHVDITFKWRDFAGSVGIPTIFVKDVQEGIKAYDQLIEPKLQRPLFTPLLDICPFEVKPSVRLKALLHDNPNKQFHSNDVMAFFDQSFGENNSARALLLRDNLSYRQDVEDALASERQLGLLTAEEREASLSSLAADHSALQAKTAKLEQELQARQAEREVLDREVRVLSRAEQSSRFHAGHLEAKLQAFKSERPALVARIAELEDDIMRRKAEQAASKAKVEELRQQVLDWENQEAHQR